MRYDPETFDERLKALWAKTDFYTSTLQDGGRRHSSPIPSASSSSSATITR